MRVSERCSCGATFEADDKAIVTSVVLDVERANAGRPQYSRTEVEAQASRWRAEHRHEMPVPSPASADAPLDAKGDE